MILFIIVLLLLFPAQFVSGSLVEIKNCKEIPILYPGFNEYPENNYKTIYQKLRYKVPKKNLSVMLQLYKKISIEYKFPTEVFEKILSFLNYNYFLKMFLTKEDILIKPNRSKNYIFEKTEQVVIGRSRAFNDSSHKLILIWRSLEIKEQYCNNLRYIAKELIKDGYFNLKENLTTITDTQEEIKTSYDNQNSLIYKNFIDKGLVSETNLIKNLRSPINNENQWNEENWIAVKIKLNKKNDTDYHGVKIVSVEDENDETIDFSFKNDSVIESFYAQGYLYVELLDDVTYKDEWGYYHYQDYPEPKNHRIEIYNVVTKKRIQIIRLPLSEKYTYRKQRFSLFYVYCNPEPIIIIYDKVKNNYLIYSSSFYNTFHCVENTKIPNIDDNTKKPIDRENKNTIDQSIHIDDKTFSESEQSITEKTTSKPDVLGESLKTETLANNNNNLINTDITTDQPLTSEINHNIEPEILQPTINNDQNSIATEKKNIIDNATFSEKETEDDSLKTETLANDNNNLINTDIPTDQPLTSKINHSIEPEILQPTINPKKPIKNDHQENFKIAANQEDLTNTVNNKTVNNLDLNKINPSIGANHKEQKSSMVNNNPKSSLFKRLFFAVKRFFSNRKLLLCIITTSVCLLSLNPLLRLLKGYL